MDFKKPICECGMELAYSTVKTGGESYKIRRDGKTYSKPSVVHRMEFVAGNLYCESCDLPYEVEWDNEDRMTKGVES